MTRAISRRPELLRAPEGDGGGGGGDKKLSLTQEELDQLIQKRVGPLTEKLRAAEATAATVAELQKKLQEADAEKAKAAEEAALKGKTDLEKLQIQLEKQDKIRKELEAERDNQKAQFTAEIEKSRKDLNDYVVRSHVSQALASGVADGALRLAEMGFLAEAQIELSEDRQIKQIAVGGKTFDKPADAAAHFLAQNKYLARPPSGGGGTPRNGGAPNGGRKFSEIPVSELLTDP